MQLSTAINIGLFAMLCLTFYMANRVDQKWKEANATLAVAHEKLKQAEGGAQYAVDVVRSWEQSLAETTLRLADVETLDRAAEAGLSSLEDIFLRHDLKSLAAKKPRLIEGLVNQGSRKAMKRLSCVSDIHRVDC